MPIMEMSYRSEFVDHHDTMVRQRERKSSPQETFSKNQPYTIIKAPSTLVKARSADADEMPKVGVIPKRIDTKPEFGYDSL